MFVGSGLVVGKRVCFWGGVRGAGGVQVNVIVLSDCNTAVMHASIVALGFKRLMHDMFIVHTAIFTAS